MAPAGNRSLDSRDSEDLVTKSAIHATRRQPGFLRSFLSLFNTQHTSTSESKTSLDTSSIDHQHIPVTHGHSVSLSSSQSSHHTASLILSETIESTGQLTQPLKCYLSKQPSDARQPSTSTTVDTINQENLDSALKSKGGFISLKKLDGEKAVAVINLTHKALVSSNLNNDQRQIRFALLRKLCGKCEVFPEAYMIREGMGINGDLAKTGGALTELWQGTYKGMIVAIKVFRLHAADDPALLKKSFYKEGALWDCLHHTNVLPFIGVATKPFQFSLVSPWMKHGNIREYIKENPQINRLPLLKDILDGLEYLHSKKIVHGDLKGPNILINDNGRACLADFGLTTVTSAMSGYQTSASTGGTWRWMAPELLAPEEFGLEKFVPSKESDIYAFGMVIYEVITGYSPFAPEVNRNEEVVLKVIRGDRPGRPTNASTINLVEAVWPIAEKCWCQIAHERLRLPQVSEILEMEISKWKQEAQPPMESSVNNEINDDTDPDFIAGKLYPD